MINLGSLRDEEVFLVIITAFMAFVSINFNSNLGLVYSVFSIIYAILVFSGKKNKVVQMLGRGEKFFESLMIAAVVTVSWVFIAKSALGILGTEVSAFDFFAHLRTQTQLPFFSQDPIFGLIVYGFAIPIVESLFFFGVLLPFMSRDVFKLPIRWYKIGSANFFKVLWVCAIVGSIASIFHVTVRISSDQYLILDFIFFTLSAFMVFLSRSSSLLITTMMHILNNSGVILSKM